MDTKIKVLAAAASLAVLAVPTAHAVELGGYFRAGPHSSTANGANRAVYALPFANAGAKYRLGNELDTYGEFALSQGGKAGNVEYKAKVMTNFYNPGNGDGGTKVGVNQIYAEGTGFDVSPASTFWIGERFYGRKDVHIVDTFYTNLTGTGAGVDTPVGPGVLGVAYFRDDGGVASRVNVDYSELPVNPGGKLRFVGTLTSSDLTDTAGTKIGKNGAALTVQHIQDNLFGLGGANTVFLQFAQGSAALNGNFGNPIGTSGAKGFRVVESLTWQVGAFGGQAQAMYTDLKDNASVKTTTMTVGGRASFALTNNFKMVGEVGYSEAKRDGFDKEKLAKLTIAPTLSIGPGFWNRPELRLFVTGAKWNGAANLHSGVNGLAGTGADKTTGTSYGFQAEMWF